MFTGKIDRLMNSKTTTIKFPTPESSSERPLADILRHDALVAILVSANALRPEYDLADEDYEYISEVRERILDDLFGLEKYLARVRK